MCMVLEGRKVLELGRLRLLPPLSRGRTQNAQKVQGGCDANGGAHASQKWKRTRSTCPEAFPPALVVLEEWDPFLLQVEMQAGCTLAEH